MFVYFPLCVQELLYTQAIKNISQQNFFIKRLYNLYFNLHTFSMKTKLLSFICISVICSAFALSGCHSGQTGSGQSLNDANKARTEQVQDEVGDNDDNGTPDITCPDDCPNGKCPDGKHPHHDGELWHGDNNARANDSDGKPTLPPPLFNHHGKHRPPKHEPAPLPEPAPEPEQGTTEESN
jgi:hypothetical protein